MTVKNDIDDDSATKHSNSHSGHGADDGSPPQRTESGRCRGGGGARDERRAKATEGSSIRGTARAWARGTPQGRSPDPQPACTGWGVRRGSGLLLPPRPGPRRPKAGGRALLAGLAHTGSCRDLTKWWFANSQRRQLLTACLEGGTDDGGGQSRGCANGQAAVERSRNVSTRSEAV